MTHLGVLPGRTVSTLLEHQGGMEQWAGEGRIVLTDAAQAHIHQYDVMHTNRFILVDRQGQVRAYIDGVYDWNLDEVMDDIQHLVSLAR